MFGRKSARQRMRRASEQALAIPAFRTPADCTPWVLGDLWPAELRQVTPETAGIADYLKADLQRIADSANDKLRAISAALLPESVRRDEQARVINVARAFAVLRVESTVRQLRNEPALVDTEYARLEAAAESTEPQIVDGDVVDAQPAESVPDEEEFGHPHHVA